MHKGMAVRMEIEPLLPDRGRGKNERTEGRIEGVAQRALARLFRTVFRVGFAEALRKPAARALQLNGR
jgi:hypothetical protein